MTRTIELAIVAWLIVTTIVYVLAIYEILGVLPDTPVHTVSFFASRNWIIAWAILIAVPLGAGVFDVWFWFHIHHVILKLAR